MKTKSIAPYVKHKDHEIIICPTNKQNGYYYKCLECNVWIGWLSKIEVEGYNKSK